MPESRTKEEIIADMTAAAQALPQFVKFLPHMEANLQAARANLALAEESGDTAEIEDWRLTVHLHICAVKFNLANQQVLNRRLARCQDEIDALPTAVVP